MKKKLDFMDNITNKIEDMWTEILDKIKDTKFYQEHIATKNWDYPKFILFIANILIVYIILVAIYNLIVPIYNGYIRWNNILNIIILISYIIYGIRTIKNENLYAIITCLVVGYIIV